MFNKQIINPIIHERGKRSSSIICRISNSNKGFDKLEILLLLINIYFVLKIPIYRGYSLEGPPTFSKFELGLKLQMNIII